MRTLSFVFILLCAGPLAAGVVHIAVSANFKATAKQINSLFEAQSEHTTTLSSASTGTLFNQIKHGAPFDVFFSADKRSVEKLEDDGLGVSGQRFCYALGSLVLVGSKNPEVDLANPLLTVAIANPKTAPYGRAALEVLQRPEFEAGHGRKLVRANNAIQAYQYWHSSSVDLALVPQSVAGGEGATIMPSWYTPIEQQLILLSNGEHNAAALAYIDLIRSAQVQALIKNAAYGACQ